MICRLILISLITFSLIGRASFGSDLTDGQKQQILKSTVTMATYTALKQEYDSVDKQNEIATLIQQRAHIVAFYIDGGEVTYGAVSSFTDDSLPEEYQPYLTEMIVLLRSYMGESKDTDFLSAKQMSLVRSFVDGVLSGAQLVINSNEN